MVGWMKQILDMRLVETDEDQPLPSVNVIIISGSQWHIENTGQ